MCKKSIYFRVLSIIRTPLIMSQYDTTFDLINVGHCDLYLMVQWFYLIFWRLFDIWTPYSGIMSLYDPMFDLKQFVAHCDLYFMVQWFCLISWKLFSGWTSYFGIHHHHIHFRALFSSTEGWAFWQVFIEGVLSTQNDFEGQQNPYLASFCHSQALHPMISLACQIFSVQLYSACVLLQSSLCCALHVQTISSYWCGAPHLSPGCQALWEGSLS